MDLTAVIEALSRASETTAGKALAFVVTLLAIPGIAWGGWQIGHRATKTSDRTHGAVLGAFLERGRQLEQDTTNAALDFKTVQKRCEEWGGTGAQCEWYLQRFWGEGRVAVFRSDRGLPPSMHPSVQAHRRALARWVWARNTRLAQFIAELSP